MFKKMLTLCLAAIILCLAALPVTGTFPMVSVAMADYKALHKGDAGEEVGAMQTRLKSLGYYSGLIDYSFGEGTFAAVKAFQRNNDLTVDGRAGNATLTKLYSPSAISASEGAHVTPNPAGTTTPLHLGDSGSDVASLQARLKELGYYTGVVDYSFGAGTFAAVKEFQKYNGLTVDGRAGTATLTKLYSSSALPHSLVDPTPTPSNIIPSRTLMKGDHGLDVGSLQNRLKVLGYYGGIIDNSFGNGIYNAIRAFQGAAGLPVNGIADAVTVQRLYAHDAPLPGTTPVPTSTTYSIPTRDLRKGDFGEDVRSLQLRLQQLGWYTGYVDSSFGNGTLAAVKAFQSACKYTVDGVAGQATIKKLFSSTAPHASSVTPTPFKYVIPKRKLSMGAKGADVLSVQRRLQVLGWYSGMLDSSFGKGTYTAVKRFQTLSGLTVDGIVGGKTVQKLFASAAATAPTYIATTPGPVSDLGYSLPNHEIKYGDKGTDVRNIQTRLKALGYYSGAIDSSFGAGTQTAVKSFQVKIGVTATGRVDPTTAARLLSSSAPSVNQ